MPDDTQEQERHQASSHETEDNVLSRRNILLGSSALVAAATLTSGALAQAQKAAPAPSGRKPNILVIFGDDIGQTNISAYSFGLVGYKTPNIDRVAKEGMMFTDYYAEKSCTAGRSSFITGQTPKRTGLSKVGIPGAPIGLQARDITIAQALKPQGYATGQFGKNHLGDRNEFSADGARLRRILRQSLSSERRRGARTAILAERRQAICRQQFTAWRAPLQGKRDGRSNRPSALGPRWQAGNRGYRPAQSQTDGNDRRRDHRRRHRFHDQADQGQQTVLLLDERDAHARVHSCARVDAGPERHAG